MKQITITELPTELDQIFAAAADEPVVLVTPNGTVYILAPADDFATEVAELRQSAAFQAFLAARTAQGRPRRPLTDVAREVAQELQDQPLV
jgi:hypothetical protein